jgi:hypothetical protein
MKRIKITKEQYNLIKENLNKSPKVKGGETRVDKLFKKYFSEGEIEPITYSNTIKPKRTNPSVSNIDKVGKQIMENESKIDYKKLSENFLNYLYIDEIKELQKNGKAQHINVSDIEFPSILSEKNLTFGSVVKSLVEQNVLVFDVDENKYIVNRIHSTKDDALKSLENGFKVILEPNEKEFPQLWYRLVKSAKKSRNLYENADFIMEIHEDGSCKLKYKDDGQEKLIDENVLNELKKIYEKDKHLMSIIESEFSDVWQKFKGDLQKARGIDSNKKKTNREELLAKIADIRKKELEKREKEEEKEEEEEEDINEITTAGSSGQYTGLFSKPITRPTIAGKIPVVYETTQGTDSVGPYDTNALIGINRDGSFKPVKKTKAQKKTQYPDGGFVEFNDCVKLNNKPAGSGCSTGAIDNVVKIKKTKGNIISPSLNEALKLQINKEKNELIVISDLEGKAASQETFTNKNILKQNGFQWNGSNWVISKDKMDIAKKTLSLVNKVEYIVDSLEELEEAIDNSATDKKSLLKSKIEMYINDLANATDEKALSAEIRRYLTFFSKFHNYSFYNRMLIFIQNPNATRVASYKKWQEKNRQVKKGAKSIFILAPIITKTKDSDEEIGDELGFKKDVSGFRAVPVFDIADTEATSPEGEIPETPQWWGDNTPSETADELFEYVKDIANNMGIKVTSSDSKSGEKGYSAGDHINLTSSVTGVARLSTMIHEIAHELMHWKKSSIYYIDNGEGKEKNELVELQAESVSYVVLKHYDLPVKHHSTYLALWKANKEKIQNNLEIISKVSEFIINMIDKEAEQAKKNKIN